MLVSHYRTKCSDVVKPAPAVDVSLHHHMWRMYSVAERVNACPRSNPAKRIAAVSFPTLPAIPIAAISLWNGEDAVEIATFDADRFKREIFQGRLLPAVKRHVNFVERFIELLFRSCSTPADKSIEIHRDHDLKSVEEEFVYCGRHDETNY